MANVASISDTAANAEAVALAPLMNGGTIVILSGTKPANANTALGPGNSVLATLTLANPAFGAPTAGVLTANAITSGVAGATGTATFARIYESDGVTVVADVTVGTSGSGIVLNTTSLVSGTTVAISSFVYTITEN